MTKNNAEKTMQTKPGNKPGAKPPMQKAAPGTTKRIFGYIFQYKWRVALVVVCILVGAAAQAGSSLFLQSLIDSYILPLVGVKNPDWSPLLRALTLMGCLYAAGTFCSWLWQWLIVTVEQGTLKKIRDDMFAHQQTLPIRYFDTNEHGDIMSRYTNDTDTLRQAISQSFPQMFSSVISALAALVSMLWLSVPVTIFVLAFTMILFVVVRKVVSRSGRYFVKQQIAIELSPEGLRVQLIDTDKRPMFELGSARVVPYLRKLLRTIAPVLNELPNRIQISGHTDSHPYPGGENGYSNWDLSADRAKASRQELVTGGHKAHKGAHA